MVNGDTFLRPCKPSICIHKRFFFSLILTLSVVIRRDKSFAKWHIQNPSVWTSEVVWDISVVWLLLSISSPACPGLDLHYWRRKKSGRLEGTSLCSYSFFFLIIVNNNCKENSILVNYTWNILWICNSYVTVYC